MIKLRNIAYNVFTVYTRTKPNAIQLQVGEIKRVHCTEKEKKKVNSD